MPKALAAGLESDGGDSEDATHCPLCMQAVPGLDTSTLEPHLGYLPDVCQPDEAQGVLDRMVRLLEAVADSPDTPAGSWTRPQQRPKRICRPNGAATDLTQ